MRNNNTYMYNQLSNCKNTFSYIKLICFCKKFVVNKGCGKNKCLIVLREKGKKSKKKTRIACFEHKYYFLNFESYYTYVYNM